MGQVKGLPKPGLQGWSGGSEIQHPGSIPGPSGVTRGGEQPLQGAQGCCGALGQKVVGGTGPRNPLSPSPPAPPMHSRAENFEK